MTNYQWQEDSMHSKVMFPEIFVETQFYLQLHWEKIFTLENLMLLQPSKNAYSLYGKTATFVSYIS